MLHQLIAEGDVVSRVTWSGTHAGEFSGVTPSGKQIVVDAVFIDRVIDERLQREGRAGVIDTLSWQLQLESMPS